MKKKHSIQYTIRRIPPRLDEALRRKARREGKSLNEAAIEALASGAGVSEQPKTHHDLDFLIGTWIEDKEFDEAIAAQDTIDPDLWR